MSADQKSPLSQGKKAVNINLLGRSRDSTSNAVYKWAINVGRIIIVLTELVALGALFYRFVIDRQIADLNDQINNQINFVRNLEAKEHQFRAVQEKLALINTIEEDTNAKVDVMNKVIEEANKGTFLSNNLSISKNIISLDGISSSIYAINNFVDNLKTNPHILSITIDEISSTNTGILFKLNIMLASASEEKETPSQTEEELL